MKETDMSPEESSLQRTEKGIDVSHWQRQINWKKVAESGVKYFCIKMTEGKAYVGPNFSNNWKGANEAGLKINCYHYYRVDSTPKEQMENIKKNLTAVEFDSAKNVLAIDFEKKNNEKATPDEMASGLNKLLNLINEEKISIKIYTSPGYWDDKVKWDKYSFGSYPLWVAHYITKPQPTLPKPWKAWSWWQYTDKGKVNKIEGFIDMNQVRIEGG